MFPYNQFGLLKDAYMAFSRNSPEVTRLILALPGMTADRLQVCVLLFLSHARFLPFPFPFFHLIYAHTRRITAK